ncbi:hypothetical protein GPECTOR_16g713 [Gonium pectorale]|uniref:Peptidase M43 pregnancy-associated plasma-A domain-containing protein n=1 Tax=Gonium pectorale TaxID=33097 RepID=A0A150GL83_GONPE|nr:hypothetical protein GPECTOR_16g713 [Gonium pectorale]|eukprot:KXZ50538.1 hypothetical protein GPECTOR_16g713 [Gonium pectorale]
MDNDAVLAHYQQMAVLAPAMRVLAAAIATLSATGGAAESAAAAYMYRPRLMQALLMERYGSSTGGGGAGGGDSGAGSGIGVLARLYAVAQELQAVSTSEGAVGAAGGPSDIAGGGVSGPQPPGAPEELRARLRAALQGPHPQEARWQLLTVFPDLDSLLDMAVEIHQTVRQISLPRPDTLPLEGPATHGSANRPAGYEPVIGLGATDGSGAAAVGGGDADGDANGDAAGAVGGGNSSMIEVKELPYTPLIIGEADAPDMPWQSVPIEDPIEAVGSLTASEADAGRRRRRSQEVASSEPQPQPAEVPLFPLPRGFKPAAPESLPKLLVPVVFHIMSYRTSDGGLGPPGVDRACMMVSRMVDQANIRLAPTRIQVFTRECRDDPAGYMYLLKPSREAWLACADKGLFADNCGAVIRPSAVDFPRSVNVYVCGEQPSATLRGYAYVPGATDDPMYGHVGLLWTVVSTDVENSQQEYESGAHVFVHEFLHHMGVPHTYSANRNDPALACSESSSDSPRGVLDTPVTAGPVWAQTWCAQAYFGCLNDWKNVLHQDWALAERLAAERVGIPPEDQDPQFDSCPQQPGFDEVANYMTDTYSVCWLVKGHLTRDQILLAHTATAAINPDLYGWSQWYAVHGAPPDSYSAAMAVLYAALQAAVQRAPPPALPAARSAPTETVTASAANVRLAMAAVVTAVVAAPVQPLRLAP